MAWVDIGVAATVVMSKAFVMATVVASTVLVRRTDVRKVQLKRHVSMLEGSRRRGSSVGLGDPLWQARYGPGSNSSAARGLSTNRAQSTKMPLQ